MRPVASFTLALVFAAALVAGTAAAQQPTAGAPAHLRSLSLADALKLAESQSEAVQIAQAGVQRAQGQQLQARSQYLPQFSGTASYTRTLKSQFSALQSSQPTPPEGTPPVPPHDPNTYYTPCTRYLAGSSATDAERLSGLDQFARCSSSGGIDFTKVGFGAANQYNLGVSGSFNLFTGGRVSAQNRAAVAGRRAADIELSSQRAQLQLDVTETYYDAALADRLAAIAESSLVQTETALRQTRLARQVGNQSEFELLRAQVTRDNQVPVLLQRKTDRDLAYLRLKQLLNLPYNDSLTLTDAIGDVETPAGNGTVRTAVATTTRPAEIPATDTSADARATVRQLTESMAANEAQLKVVRAERMPAISLSSQYGRVAFPRGGAPTWDNFLSNWTVSIGASMPIFTGGRIRGEEMVAQANLAESRARLQQTRELAALDSRLAIAQLEEAQATMAASAGTAQQASRAYQIAEVRWTEGISTQLELTESRILLEQAMANRALAARNLQVARVRLALLKDLPLSTGGAATFAPPTTGGSGATMPSAGASSGAGATTPQGTQQPRAGQASAGITGSGQ